MWTQRNQREKLRRLSPEARVPVLKFLQDRPPLIRNLQRDSPHLREALLLAVDAVGQANEKEQWETLAEILMDACTANPAQSSQLSDTLESAIPKSGGGWFKNAIGGFFGVGRQNAQREKPASHAIELDRSDSDDFQIGTTPTNATQQQPRADSGTRLQQNKPAPSPLASKPAEQEEDPAAAHAQSLAKPAAMQLHSPAQKGLAVQVQPFTTASVAATAGAASNHSPQATPVQSQQVPQIVQGQDQQQLQQNTPMQEQLQLPELGSAVGTQLPTVGSSGTAHEHSGQLPPAPALDSVTEVAAEGQQPSGSGLEEAEIESGDEDAAQEAIMQTLVRPRVALRNRAPSTTSASQYPPSLLSTTPPNGAASPVSMGAFPTIPGAALASIAPSSGWRNWDNPAYRHEPGTSGAASVAPTPAQGDEATPRRHGSASSLALTSEQEADLAFLNALEGTSPTSPTPALDADQSLLSSASSPASSPAMDTAQDADANSMGYQSPASLSPLQPAVKQPETTHASPSRGTEDRRPLFPMPTQSSGVSVAPFKRPRRTQAEKLQDIGDCLPDPATMTEEELLNFDFSVIERRLSAISKRYTRAPLRHGAAGSQSDEDSDDSSDAQQQEGSLSKSPKPKRQSALSKLKSYRPYMPDRSNDDPLRVVPYNPCKEDIFSISLPSMNVLESPFRMYTEGTASLSLLNTSDANQSAADPPMLMPVPETASTLALAKVRSGLKHHPANSILDAARGPSAKRLADIDASSDLAEIQAQLASLNKTLSEFQTSNSLSTSQYLASLPELPSTDLTLQAITERRKAMEADTARRQQRLAEDKKRHAERMAELRKNSGPPTEVAEAIQRGVADWKAGRVKDRGEAVRARVAELFKNDWMDDDLDLAPLPPIMQPAPLPCFKPGLSPIPEMSTAVHKDPEDHLLDTAASSVDVQEVAPLGISPAFNSPYLWRPAMKPGKSHRPGRGPMCVSFTHPDTRIFSVAQSSYAIREAAWQDKHGVPQVLRSRRPSDFLHKGSGRASSAAKPKEFLPGPLPKQIGLASWQAHIAALSDEAIEAAPDLNVRAGLRIMKQEYVAAYQAAAAEQAYANMQRANSAVAAAQQAQTTAAPATNTSLTAGTMASSSNVASTAHAEAGQGQPPAVKQPQAVSHAGAAAQKAIAAPAAAPVNAVQQTDATPAHSSDRKAQRIAAVKAARAGAQPRTAVPSDTPVNASQGTAGSVNAANTLAAEAASANAVQKAAASSAAPANATQRSVAQGAAATAGQKVAVPAGQQAGPTTAAPARTAQGAPSTAVTAEAGQNTAVAAAAPAAASQKPAKQPIASASTPPSKAVPSTAPGPTGKKSANPSAASGSAVQQQNATTTALPVSAPQRAAAPFAATANAAQQTAASSVVPAKAAQKATAAQAAAAVVKQPNAKTSAIPASVVAQTVAVGVAAAAKRPNVATATAATAPAAQATAVAAPAAVKQANVSKATAAPATAATQATAAAAPGPAKQTEAPQASTSASGPASPLGQDDSDPGKQKVGAKQRKRLNRARLAEQEKAAEIAKAKAAEEAKAAAEARVAAEEAKAAAEEAKAAAEAKAEEERQQAEEQRRQAEAAAAARQAALNAQAAARAEAEKEKLFAKRFAEATAAGDALIQEEEMEKRGGRLAAIAEDPDVAAKRAKKAAKKQRQKLAAAAVAYEDAEEAPGPSKTPPPEPAAAEAAATAAPQTVSSSTGAHQQASDLNKGTAKAAKAQGELAKAQQQAATGDKGKKPLAAPAEPTAATVQADAVPSKGKKPVAALAEQQAGTTQVDTAPSKGKKPFTVPAEQKPATAQADAAPSKGKQQTPGPAQQQKGAVKSAAGSGDLDKGKQQAVTPDQQKVKAATATNQAGPPVESQTGRDAAHTTATPDSAGGPSQARATEFSKPKPGKKKPKQVGLKEPPPIPGSPAENGAVPAATSTSHQDIPQGDEPNSNGAALFPDELVDSFSPAYHSPLHAKPQDDSGGWTEVLGANATRNARGHKAAPKVPAQATAQRRPTAAPLASATANALTRDTAVPALRIPAVHTGPSSSGWTEDFARDGDIDGVEDGDDELGLAALEGLPPQRRRGTRAGKRHKKRPGFSTCTGLSVIGEDWESDDDASLRSGYSARQRQPGSPQAGEAWPTLARDSRHSDDGPDFPPGFPRQTEATGTDNWPSLPGTASAAGAHKRPAPGAKAAASKLTQEKVAAASAAALAATAGIVRGPPRKAAPAAAPWNKANGATGGNESAWEAAEDPVAAAKHRTAQAGSEAKGAPINAEAAINISADATADPADWESLDQLVDDLEDELESMYCCPLTLELFTDPVTAADGKTYERFAIAGWLENHDTSPMTNEPMPHKELIPNKQLLRKQRKVQQRLKEVLASLPAEA